MIRHKLSVLVLILCLLWVKPAGAVTTTYVFTGSLTRLDLGAYDSAGYNAEYSDISLWLPGLYEGMPFLGKLSYDPGSWNVDQYGSVEGASWDLQVFLGDYDFHAGGGNLSAANDTPDDSMGFVCMKPDMLAMPVTPVVYFAPDDLALSLRDPTGNVISDLNLPVGNLEQFAEARIVFDGDLGMETPTGFLAATMVWDATNLSIQVVPEPSSFLILGLGVAGMVLRQKRSARRNS